MTLHSDSIYRSCLVAGLATLALGAPTLSHGQGCVTSRGAGGMTSCPLDHATMDGHHDRFQADVSYRWFRSDRMFSGDSEDPTSDPQINRSQFIDISLRYNINPRFSAAVTLPYAWHDRSQLVRRLNLARTILGEFHTKASGIGDIRVAGDAWILDPAKYMKGNIQMGLGLTLPTGDKDAMSTFSVGGAGLIPSAVSRSVDPSIQPGSGGFGLVFNLYAYRQILPRLNSFLTGAYTFTPQDQYTPTASSVAGYNTYSIADSYNARSGLEYMLWPAHSLALSLAGRIEGVPVSDPIGGSSGFRRPGYAVSIEPGVTASWRSWTFSVTAPVAVYRNRLQNETEKAAAVPAAAAGFADYQLLFNLSKRF